MKMKKNTLPKATEKEFARRELYREKAASGRMSEKENMEFLDFMNSYEWSSEFYEENGKHGIKSVLGKIIVPALYDDFRCSLYQVEHQEAAAAMNSGKWGLVATDGTGAPLTEFIYDYVAPVAGPLAVAAKDGKWEYLGMNGKSATSDKMDRILVGEDGLTFINGISIFMVNGRYGVTDGLLFSRAVFDEILEPEGGDWITGFREGEKGYINEAGDFTEDENEAWWEAAD
jgi:hypothetical protein